MWCMRTNKTNVPGGQRKDQAVKSTGSIRDILLSCVVASRKETLC